MRLDESRVELQRTLDTRQRALGVAGGLLQLGHRVVRKRIARPVGNGDAGVFQRDVKVAVLAATRGQEQVRRGAFGVIARAYQDSFAFTSRGSRIAGAEALPGVLDSQGRAPGLSHRRMPPAPPGSAVAMP